MNPGRWQQVKEVLGVALECPSRAERTRYLSGACAGDATLRREVEALLDQTTSSLGTYADVAGPTAGAEPEPAIAWATPGRRVGAYALERELGRGGMGAVWLARRADGRFEQTVAVKVLKRGTDTEEVLRRFRAERQILARLEHPNIARLLDGGETDDGLPFLVMEFVDGAPITEFVRQHRPPIGTRVELFRKVCAAVEFAHQRLVIHRDLKPSNILVTPDGEPKLLDFGIAKLVDPELDAELTLADQRRLTPAYASPEQVRGVAVTTVSDVYSLGALLYEILVSRSPHRRAPAAELARVILYETPTRPCLAAEEPEARRRLRGDLDTVILRALAKDSARRYASVRALSEDLRRWSEGWPVHARADTASYRAQKFIARHKLLVAGASAVALSLIGGGAAAVWQARRAKRRFQDVRELAKSVLFEMEEAIAVLPGSTPARQLLITRALRYLDRLAADAGDDRALRLELGAAYLKVGDVQGRPYQSNLGDAPGALHSYARAAALAAPLAAGERGWTDVSARLLLGRAWVSAGEVEARLGHVEAAAGFHRRALDVARPALAADFAHADDWRRLVAGALAGLGDALSASNHAADDLATFRAALGHYREALPVCELLAAGRGPASPEARRLGGTCIRLANTLAAIARKTGDRAAFAECFTLHDRAVAILEAGVRAAPEDARLARSLAGALDVRGSARGESGENLDAGEADCARAVEMLRALAAADPSNAEARQDLSSALYDLGFVRKTRGEWSRAADAFRDSLMVLEPLIAAQPGNVETAFDLRRTRAALVEAEARLASTAPSRPD